MTLGIARLWNQLTGTAEDSTNQSTAMEDNGLEESKSEEILEDDIPLAQLCATSTTTPDPDKQSTESPHSQESTVQEPSSPSTTEKNRQSGSAIEEHPSPTVRKKPSPPPLEEYHRRRSSSSKMDSTPPSPAMRKKPPPPPLKDYPSPRSSAKMDSKPSSTMRKKSPPPPRDEEEYFDPWAEDQEEEQPAAAVNQNEDHNESQSLGEASVDQVAIANAIEEYMEDWDMEGDDFQEVLELGNDDHNNNASFGATQQQAVSNDRKRPVPESSTTAPMLTKKAKPSSSDPTKQRRTKWSEMLNILLEYQDEQKHLSPLPTQEFKGKALGKWAHEQRLMYQRRNLFSGNYKLLIERRIRELDRLGFSWDIVTPSLGRTRRIQPSAPSQKRASWDTLLQQLKLYHQTHGHWRPEKNELFQGYKLGAWLHEMERTYERRRAGKMSAAFALLADERFAKMRAIGFEFGEQEQSSAKTTSTMDPQQIGADVESVEEAATETQSSGAPTEDESKTLHDSILAISHEKPSSLQSQTESATERTSYPTPGENVHDSNSETSKPLLKPPPPEILTDEYSKFPDTQIWKHIAVRKNEKGWYHQRCKFCDKESFATTLNTTQWKVHLVDPVKGCQYCPLAIRLVVAANSKAVDVQKARARLEQLPSFERKIFPEHVVCDRQDDGPIHEKCKYCDTVRKGEEQNPIFWLTHLADITKCPKCPLSLRQELAAMARSPQRPGKGLPQKPVVLKDKKSSGPGAGRANDQHSMIKTPPARLRHPSNIQVPKQKPERLKALTQEYIGIKERDDGFKIQTCRYCAKSWTLPKLSPTLWAMHLMDPNKCHECPDNVRQSLVASLDDTVEKNKSSPVTTKETQTVAVAKKKAEELSIQPRPDIAPAGNSQSESNSVMIAYKFVNVTKDSTRKGHQIQTCKYCGKTIDGKRFRTQFWVNHFTDPLDLGGCSNCPDEVRAGLSSYKKTMASSNQALATYQEQADQSTMKSVDNRSSNSKESRPAARPPVLIGPFMASPYPVPPPMMNQMPMPWYPNAYQVPPPYPVPPPHFAPPPRRRKLPDFIHPERYMDI